MNRADTATLAPALAFELSLLSAFRNNLFSMKDSTVVHSRVNARTAIQSFPENKSFLKAHTLDSFTLAPALASQSLQLFIEIQSIIIINSGNSAMSVNYCIESKSCLEADRPHTITLAPPLA